MKRSHSVAARVAAVGILAGATLVGKPIALQRGGPGVSRQVMAVNGRPAAAGEVLVKFRRELASFERGQLDQQTDADQNHVIGGTGVRRIHSRRYDTATLLAFLGSHPDVAYVEPNYIVQADAVPNDTFFGQLWGLLNNGQTIGVAGTPGADIGASSAWDVSTGSRANVVAVTDTGVDYTHSDLAANIWSAPAPFSVTIGGQTITCAAGTHGFNAITKTCDPYDDSVSGHGTHVSGTIGALGNNNHGVAGVNWTASIMASKFLDANGTGTLADSINAIEFVIQAAAATGANVRVLSNSWSSGGPSQALLDEINKAGAHNMLFVASAGNFGQNIDTDQQPQHLNFPASYAVDHPELQPPLVGHAANLIAVAATDNTDTLAVTSDYGFDLGPPRRAGRKHFVDNPRRRVPVHERHVDGRAPRGRCRGAGALALRPEHHRAQEQPARQRRSAFVADRPRGVGWAAQRQHGHSRVHAGLFAVGDAVDTDEYGRRPCQLHGHGDPGWRIHRNGRAHRERATDGSHRKLHSGIGHDVGILDDDGHVEHDDANRQLSVDDHRNERQPDPRIRGDAHHQRPHDYDERRVQQ